MLSDTHGAPARLPADQDWILHAGDLYNRRRNRRGREPKNSIDKRWDVDNLCIVHGNHDCDDPVGIFNSRGITGSIKQLADDMYVAGLGWHGQYYYDLPTESDLKDVASHVVRRAIVSVPNGARLILLTHYPALMPELFPYQGDARGWMYQSVTDLIATLSPMLVVQGHVHDLFGTAGKYKLHNGETTVVNPGPGGVYADIDGFTIGLSHADLHNSGQR